MTNLIRTLWSEDAGQDIAEYAVMLAVILVLDQMPITPFPAPPARCSNRSFRAHHKPLVGFAVASRDFMKRFTSSRAFTVYYWFPGVAAAAQLVGRTGH